MLSVRLPTNKKMLSIHRLHFKMLSTRTYQQKNVIRPPTYLHQKRYPSAWAAFQNVYKLIAQLSCV